MNAVPSSIAQVFEGQKQYVIPVFQRTYEWGKNRWSLFGKTFMQFQKRTMPI